MSTRLTPEARFLAGLKQHQRVAIAGVGGSGKTTHWSAMVKDRLVFHTDDYIETEADRRAGVPRGWADVPRAVAVEIPWKLPCVVEGVRALAVLTEFAKLYPGEGAPFTLVIWLDQPHESVRYTPEQARAAKGRRTNFAKWLRENRDVEVVRL
jgi:hypothetical protein